MSQKTLSEILIDVNSFVDLEAALPTGDELSTRQNYATQSVWDAAGVGQLRELDSVYEVDPGSDYRVTMPANFKEFTANPQQLVSGSWREYPEILPEERFSKKSGDYYCYVLGNPASGYQVVFNNLEASCTLSFSYQAFPTGFPTLTSICELSDPTYVTAQVESYILQARGDDRFPYVDTVAQKKLKNLFAKSMKSPGGQGRATPSGFRNPLG